MKTHRNSTTPAARWAQITSLALSLGAVAIAAYLTATHYSDPASLACPDTGVINCALVTTSSWSVVLGIPVAVFGLVWSLAMVALTLPWSWRARSVGLDRARIALSGIGAATVLYLIYIELFRIGAVCLWCTAVHVLAVCLFAVVLTARTTGQREAEALT